MPSNQPAITINQPYQLRFPSNQVPFVRYNYAKEAHVVYELCFVPEEKRTREHPHKYKIRALYGESSISASAVVGEWSWFNNRGYLRDMQIDAKRKLLIRARELVVKSGKRQTELIRLIKRTA